MTRMMGVPDYEYAVAPHPLSSLTDAECRRRAEELAPGRRAHPPGPRRRRGVTAAAIPNAGGAPPTPRPRHNYQVAPSLPAMPRHSRHPHRHSRESGNPEEPITAAPGTPRHSRQCPVTPGNAPSLPAMPRHSRQCPVTPGNAPSLPGNAPSLPGAPSLPTQPRHSRHNPVTPDNAPSFSAPPPSFPRKREPSGAHNRRAGDAPSPPAAPPSFPRKRESSGAHTLRTGAHRHSAPPPFPGNAPAPPAPPPVIPAKAGIQRRYDRGGRPPAIRGRKSPHPRLNRHPQYGNITPGSPILSPMGRRIWMGWNSA